MALIDSTTKYGLDSLEDTIIANIKAFLKEGLLEIGSFINVEKDQVYHNHDLSKLYPFVNRPGINDYTVYGGGKDDWIWEQNITLATIESAEPNVPSGIYVDNTFYPTGTDISGTGYYIDFARGRVVFDNPLSSGASVQVPRGLRFVSVYDGDSYQQREIVANWFSSPANASGFLDSYNAKAFLPAIFVSVPSYKTLRGSQLGSRGRVINANVRFDIMTHEPSSRKKLTDLCYYLETKPIQLFDSNLAISPLDYEGRLINAQANYQYLGTNYPLSPQIARFDDNAKIVKYTNQAIPMFASRVDISLEMDVYPRI